MDSFLKFNPFSSSPQALNNPFSLYTAVTDNEKKYALGYSPLNLSYLLNCSYLEALIIPEAHKIMEFFLHFFSKEIMQLNSLQWLHQPS